MQVWKHYFRNIYLAHPVRAPLLRPAIREETSMPFHSFRKTVLAFGVFTTLAFGVSAPAFAAEPSTLQQAEANSDLARRFYSLINGGPAEQWRVAFAPTWVATPPLPSNPDQLSGYEQVISAFRAGIPDLKVEQVEVVANDDVVAVRSRVTGTNTATLFGKPPTGKAVSFTAMDIHRIKDGKIIETWHVEDFISMNGQLAGQ
jgi:predicted ester cyclase